MKKWLVIALFVPATAQAAPAADCKALMLAGVNRVSYRTQAAFPAEPETVSVEFFDVAAPAGPLSLCGFTFSPDRKAQVLSVGAPKLAAFANIFPEGYRVTGKISLENVLYENDIHTTSVLFDPKTSMLDFDRGSAPVIRMTLGVKIDGGPLQPLFYQNAPRTIRVPKTARVIDIYAKTLPDTRSAWQRVTIDLRKPRIAFYKKAPFPAK